MLDARQRRAVELLAAGWTHTDTAKEIGADRATVTHWVNGNGEFRALLDEALNEVAAETRRMLRGSTARKVKRLDEIGESPDEAVALRAILAWLDRAGVTVDAAQPAPAAQPADVNEVLAYMRWRAEQQAKQPAASEPQSEGETDAGPRD